MTDQVADLIQRHGFDCLCQIAGSDRLGEGTGATESSAEGERHPEGGPHPDEKRDCRGANQQETGAFILVCRIVLGLTEEFSLQIKEFIDLLVLLGGQLPALAGGLRQCLRELAIVAQRRAVLSFESDHC